MYYKSDKDTDRMNAIILAAFSLRQCKSFAPVVLVKVGVMEL